MYYFPHLKRKNEKERSLKWFITVWGREAATWRPRFSARSIWPPKLIPSPGHGARCHSIIWFRNAPVDRPFWWTVTFLEAPLSLMSCSSTWPPTTICPTARTVRMGWGGVGPANDAFPIAPKGVKCSRADPWTMWRLECQPPCCPKSAHNFDSPQTKLLIVSCCPEASSITVNTFWMLCVLYTVCLQ